MSIFSQGTCLKSELYDRIIGILESAGWTNVASNPTTEFAVMNSKGESGDKDLFFQLRPFAVAMATSNDVRTTTASTMSYRLINSYTPNETQGSDGTFARTSEAWKTYNLAPGNIDPAVELTYWYTVNKDRLIINVYTPESLNMLATLFYIGLPTHFTSEPNSKGVVALSSYASTQASVLISDNVAELPSATASVAMTNYISLAPKSPNSAGIHTPSELLFGSTAVGIRGKIDSIYFLPNNSINDGDILKLGANRYRATMLGVSSNNSFPSNVAIYQIS